MQLVAATCTAAGRDFYYSIHGASYQDQQQALRHIETAKNMGYPAFTEPVDIPGKGLWYRVYIGRFDNREEAKRVAGRLRKKNIVDDVRINRFLVKEAEARSASVKKEKKDAKRLTAPSAPLAASPVEARATGSPEARKRDPQEKTATPVGGKAPLSRIVSQSALPDRGAREERRDEQRKPPEPQAPLWGEAQRPEGVEPSDSPLSGALEAYKAQRYEQAIELLNVLLKNSSHDKAVRERGLRLLADCHYAWGLRGDRQKLLAAVDQYKNILHRYPDPAEGNDRLYYHMAVSYERLNFFYEASGSWEKLILIYPHSPFLQEAMFRVGDVLRPTAKYGRAADKLLAYLRKYPEGLFAKQAYFILGDCYYRMQRNDLAGRWFDEARKRWSDLHDIQQTILFNMGSNYHLAGRFDEAFQVYSLCATLYSPSDFGKDNLFRAARSADEAGYAEMAVRLYSDIMTTHPGDALVEECSLALANLGIFRPGLRVAIDDANMDDYREPLKTYRRILAKSRKGDLAERTILSQARAFERKGTPRSAVANYLELVNRFPRSPYHAEALGLLKTLALSLIPAYHAKGDHLAVSDLHFQVKGKFNLTEDFEAALKAGRSLQMIGLDEEANGLLTLLQEMHKTDRAKGKAMTQALAEMDSGKKPGDAEQKGQKDYLKIYKDYQQHPDRYDQGQIADLFIGLGDGYFSGNKYKEGVAMYRQALPHLSDVSGKKWLILKMGQGYARLQDFEEAEKSLAQLKEGGAEEFWTKIADLYIEDSKRMEQYGVRR